MKLSEYNSKSGYRIYQCQICLELRRCCQHHIESGSGRSSSRIIWICLVCHGKVHNPTAFNLPASWAYDNGYLIRHNNKMVKKEKTKKCDHASSYFDSRLGYIKCNFCGKQVDTINFGTKKKKI